MNIPRLIIPLLAVVLLTGCSGTQPAQEDLSALPLFPTDELFTAPAGEVEIITVNGSQMEIAANELVVTFTDGATRADYNAFVQELEKNGDTIVGQIPTTRQLEINTSKMEKSKTEYSALTYIAQVNYNLIVTGLGGMVE